MNITDLSLSELIVLMCAMPLVLASIPYWIAEFLFYERHRRYEKMVK